MERLRLMASMSTDTREGSTRRGEVGVLVTCASVECELVEWRVVLEVVDIGRVQSRAELGDDTVMPDRRLSSNTCFFWNSLIFLLISLIQLVLMSSFGQSNVTDRLLCTISNGWVTTSVPATLMRRHSCSGSSTCISYRCSSLSFLRLRGRVAIMRSVNRKMCTSDSLFLCRIFKAPSRTKRRDGFNKFGQPTSWFWIFTTRISASENRLPSLM
mmetsp:Transcript_46225/g.116404  ORF Transcript_46225/g.116404 Transcript_46225/m.116404 type:complete len:214 (-) Transcript_46225:802-1443(-)